MAKNHIGCFGLYCLIWKLKRYATTANMDADISFEDMQEGLNGLYEDGKVQG